MLSLRIVLAPHTDSAARESLARLVKGWIDGDHTQQDAMDGIEELGGHVEGWMQGSAEKASWCRLFEAVYELVEISDYLDH